MCTEHLNTFHQHIIKSPPVITIIVAVLNGIKTIDRCLQSVFRQVYPNIELIVMDGDSTDGTKDVLRSCSDKITYWESRPDHGIYHAWNKALLQATGEWICFLGADDFLWNDHVLNDMAPQLIKAAGKPIRIVYGQVARVDEAGNVVSLWGKPWEKIRWQMKHGMPLGMPHPGLMHHFTLFQDHGLFDETFRIVGDYEFLLRELSNPDTKALYLPHIRTVGHQTGGISDIDNLSGHWEISRARRKNGCGSYSWLWFLVHIRAMARHIWRKWLQH